MDLGNPSTVWDWLEHHADEPERCEALLTWVEMACREPEILTTGMYVNARNGRLFRFCDSVAVGARITFTTHTAPVHCLIIQSIDEDLFRTGR